MFYFFWLILFHTVISNCKHSQNLQSRTHYIPISYILLFFVLEGCLSHDIEEAMTWRKKYFCLVDCEPKQNLKKVPHDQEGPQSAKAWAIPWMTDLLWNQNLSNYENLAPTEQLYWSTYFPLHFPFMNKSSKK